jgi:UDP-N-acetyl-D-glucosamine dehydrogenase
LLELERKLKEKTAIIGIVGLGYVGLPLAVAFSKASFRVIGFDIQQKRVVPVNKEHSFIIDVNSERSLMRLLSSVR